MRVICKKESKNVSTCHNTIEWSSRVAENPQRCWLAYWGDVVLQTSSGFWKLIEERRKEPTLSMKELRSR
jgi:hypothetical protein